MHPDFDSRNYSNVSLKLPVLGEELSLHVYEGKDLVSDTLRNKRMWEAYETEIVIKTLKEGDCFVDIGANIGYYSLIASRLCGSHGRVYAFEPEMENFKLLKRNTGAANNTRLFNLALADTESEQTLFLSADNSGDHRLGKLEAREHQGVKTIRGDSVLSGRLDFIKIDTQGAEFKVLKGLERVLKQNLLHLHMIVEFWPYGLSLQGNTVDELIRFLFALKMDVYIIDHQRHCLYPAHASDLERFSAEQYLQGKESGFLNLFLANGPVSNF